MARPATPKKASLPRNPRVHGKVRADGAARKADVVARDLMGQIAHREIEVGAVLPKEDDLASSYGVNRGVIREAVKLLEVHRLVNPVKRRGTVVLEPLRSTSPEVLAALLVPRPGHVDRKVLSAFLEVRALLDVEMLALAAARRTATDLKAIRALLADLAELVSAPHAFSERVLELPLLVARATKNPVFEMLAAFNGRVISELEGMSIVTRPASPEHVEGLRVMVDILERKDVEGARQVVRAFHEWSIPRILASAALTSGSPPSRPAPENVR